MRASLLLSLLVGCGDQLLTPVKETPAIAVTPASLVFDAPGSQTVTVSSVGDAPLDIVSVGFRSESAFTLASAGGLPGTLDPEAEAELVVTWAPGDENTGWLDIVSDDPDAPLVAVALSGLVEGDTGTDTGGGDTAEPLAAATLDPADATLEAPVGDTVTATFTLANTGDVELVLDASVSGAGFALASTPPQTLAAGASLTLEVAFSPTAEGAYAGSLDVTVADVGPLAATLSGTGLAVEELEPATFTWTGAAQTWTVPDGVTSVTIEAWGAGGGAGAYTGAYAGTGGGGGYASTALAVTPGDVLTIRPGQGGQEPGGGGGASLVYDDAGTLVLVAGGGGGGGTDGGSRLSGSGAGGAGGGATGSAGDTQFDGYWGSASGGAGGTASAGGAGGSAYLVAAGGPACTGGAGGSLVGGGGATGSSSCTFGTAASLDASGTGASNGAGGGGGAGWYGGGGGGSVYTYFGGGGGGGSSWAASGSVEAGSGATPGGTSSTMWDGAAGAGGTPGTWPSTPSTDGTAGRVAIW